MRDAKCKICRRLGVKLFLKGEKCLLPKCPMVKKAYPPGQRRKRRPSPLSEYGKELREKQKLKNWYNLKEKQFKKYVKEILQKGRRGEDVADFLIKKLESRLDNVVFRLGFASSRAQARQLISHGHFLVNGRTINIPSYQLKKGDKITISAKTRKKTIFHNFLTLIKKQKPPPWLQLNVEKLEGKVIGLPTLDEAGPPVEISPIFEFYSR